MVVSKRKPLDKIRHGQVIVDAFRGYDRLIFADIGRKSSLDEKSIKVALPQLLKYGYIVKDERGNYYLGN